MIDKGNKKFNDEITTDIKLHCHYNNTEEPFLNLPCWETPLKTIFLCSIYQHSHCTQLRMVNLKFKELKLKELNLKILI